jgi:hypothetical protein
LQKGKPVAGKKTINNMKTEHSFLIIILAIMLSPVLTHAQDHPSAAKQLRHVVLFKFKDTSSEGEVKKVEDAFKGLAKKISLIKDFEWGTNNSPENLNQGLTHCFLVTFGSEKDRNAYLVHPEHQAFVEILKPHLDKVTVIDYWTK